MHMYNLVQYNDNTINQVMKYITILKLPCVTQISGIARNGFVLFIVEHPMYAY